MVGNEKQKDSIPVRWEWTDGEQKEMVLVTDRPRVGDNLSGQVIRSVHRYGTETGEYAYTAAMTLDHTGTVRRHIGIECEDGSFRWSTYPLGISGSNKLNIELELYNIYYATNQGCVVIAASEVNADALMERKYTATASPLGLGQFWPAWIKRFEGKAVIIMPDNTTQSRIEAYKLSSQLIQVCSRLDILTVPYRPEEDTLADFLDRLKRETAEEKITAGLFDEWVYQMTEIGPDLTEAIVRDQHLLFYSECASELEKLIA